MTSARQSRSLNAQNRTTDRLRLDIFTLFPEWFTWFKGQRHVVNSVENGSEIRLFNYRDTTHLSNRQVDDTPYGGGPGMVLRVDVVDSALKKVYGDERKAMLEKQRIVVLTPSGRKLDEGVVRELAGLERITLLCARYEGFDERVREFLSNDAISIGNYVLSGGELASMVVADSVIRKLPGSLGDEESCVEESFSEALSGAPEYPHYTRPAEYSGWQVPDVLLSGDHSRIRKWRMKRSNELAQ